MSDKNVDKEIKNTDEPSVILPGDVQIGRYAKTYYGYSKILDVAVSKKGELLICYTKCEESCDHGPEYWQTRGEFLVESIFKDVEYNETIEYKIEKEEKRKAERRRKREESIETRDRKEYERLKKKYQHLL